MRVLFVLLLLCATATVAAPKLPEQPTPAPVQNATKATLLVFDPTNLAQNIAQVQRAVDQLLKLQEQLDKMQEQLDVAEDIFDSQYGVRGAIADLANSPEEKARRRYMPSEWLCATGVGAGTCNATGPFGTAAGFFNSVTHTPDAGEIYSQYGAMLPEQHAAYYWRDGATNAAMASANVVNDDMDDYQNSIEDLMEQIRGGHAVDLKGSMDLNTRATLEAANQQALTNRLLAQTLFLLAAREQAELANVAAAAKTVRIRQGDGQ